MSETGSENAPAEHVKVRRVPDRGAYDRATIDAVLDAGWVAHVATVRDGKPFVIPMYYVRDGDSILLHGAPAAGTIRDGKGVDVCATITMFDGFVLARSAFHHSMNYRSVVVHGVATHVADPAEKEAALELFVERMVPGRQAMLRPTTPKEIQGTGVLRLSLEYAAAKIRDGGPVDDDEDYENDNWAGVVAVTETYGEPVGDGRSPDGVEVPANVVAFSESA